MRRFPARLLLAGAALVLTAGCATSEEWAIWRQNNAHFASLDHFKFSNRNREGQSAQVSRADVQKAREQNWWGRAITVAQEELLEK
ncbi:MAG: hypothetical protein AABZ83_04150 [candidate division NC10 bacterium]